MFSTYTHQELLLQAQANVSVRNCVSLKKQLFVMNSEVIAFPGIAKVEPWFLLVYEQTLKYKGCRG